MFDTHAHLNHSSFAGKVGKIINESQKEGVEKILVPGVDLSSSKNSLLLAEKHLGVCFSSAGVHPSFRGNSKKEFQRIELFIRKNLKEVKAVGECGLDFTERYLASMNKKEQIFLFERHIKLAEEASLPLIIHARKAVKNAIKILEERNCKTRGVFHCFAGGKKEIKDILNLPGSWFFGIDGNITWDKKLKKIVSLIPLEKLLLETDSPYLSPVPHRGETNTPANLKFVAQEVARIKKKNLKEVQQRTSHNAERLFL